MKYECHLREQRDWEFIRLYKKKRNEYEKQGKTISKKDLIEEVINEGKPFYHIGFEYAYLRLKQMQRGESYNPKKSLRRSMWVELKEKVDNLMKKRPNYKLSDALSVVLAECRASRFYISPNYAYKYLYKSL